MAAKNKHLPTEKEKMKKRRKEGKGGKGKGRKMPNIKKKLLINISYNHHLQLVQEDTIFVKKYCEINHENKRKNRELDIKRNQKKTKKERKDNER